MPRALPLWQCAPCEARAHPLPHPTGGGRGPSGRAQGHRLGGLAGLTHRVHSHTGLWPLPSPRRPRTLIGRPPSKANLADVQRPRSGPPTASAEVLKRSCAGLTGAEGQPSWPGPRGRIGGALGTCRGIVEGSGGSAKGSVGGEGAISRGLGRGAAERCPGPACSAGGRAQRPRATAVGASVPCRRRTAGDRPERRPPPTPATGPSRGALRLSPGPRPVAYPQGAGHRRRSAVRNTPPKDMDRHPFVPCIGGTSVIAPPPPRSTARATGTPE